MNSNVAFCAVLPAILVMAGCTKKQSQETEAMHQAARAGDVAEVQSLISRGADVNVQDVQGATRCTTPRTMGTLAWPDSC
jgi:hypothetical protein